MLVINSCKDDVIIYITDLDSLSNRSKNAIQRVGIKTLNKLVENQDFFTANLSGIGNGILNEIKQVIEHSDEIIKTYNIKREKILLLCDDMKDIPIELFKFNSRAYNVLRKRGIYTIDKMIQLSKHDIEQFSIGPAGSEQIIEVINGIIENGIDYILSHDNSDLPIDGQIKIYNIKREKILLLCDDVKDMPIELFKFNSRAYNVLRKRGIYTIDKMLQLSKHDIEQFSIGPVGSKQIIEAINGIIENGIDYIPCHDNSDVHTDGQEKKGMDFFVINRLTEEFKVSISQISIWIGIPKQKLLNLCKKKDYRRQNSWTKNTINEYEKSIIQKLIEDKVYDYKGTEFVAYCINNQKDNIIFVFVYENKIKCYFLNELDEGLQNALKHANYDRFTISEQNGDSNGEVINILRKPYFFPNDLYKFSKNANKRKMSNDEYSIFISGYHLGDSRSVRDDRIISFMEE